MMNEYDSFVLKFFYEIYEKGSIKKGDMDLNQANITDW